MNPIDLNELERLHAAAKQEPIEIDPRWTDDKIFRVTLANAFPALVRELRARRQVMKLMQRLCEAYQLEYRNGVSEGWIKKGFCQGIIFKALHAEIASALDHIGESTEKPAAPAKGGEGEK